MRLAATLRSAYADVCLRMLTCAVALQVRLPATLRSAGSTAFFFWGGGQVKSFKDVKHVEVKHVEGGGKPLGPQI